MAREFRQQLNRDAHEVMGVSAAELWRQRKTGVLANSALQDQLDMAIEVLMSASIAEKPKIQLSKFDLFRFKLMDRIDSLTRRMFPQKVL